MPVNTVCSNSWNCIIAEILWPINLDLNRNWLPSLRPPAMCACAGCDVVILQNYGLPAAGRLSEAQFSGCLVRLIQWRTYYSDLSALQHTRKFISIMPADLQVGHSLLHPDLQLWRARRDTLSDIHIYRVVTCVELLKRKGGRLLCRIAL